MKTLQYPLQVPEDLMAQVKKAAKSFDLSQADVMRQSMRLGLPKLREQLRQREGRVTNVDPLPDAVMTRLYREREDDASSIRRFIAGQPKGVEE